MGAYFKRAAANSWTCGGGLTSCLRLRRIASVGQVALQAPQSIPFLSPRLHITKNGPPLCHVVQYFFTSIGLVRIQGFDFAERQILLEGKRQGHLGLFRCIEVHENFLRAGHGGANQLPLVMALGQLRVQFQIVHGSLLINYLTSPQQAGGTALAVQRKTLHIVSISREAQPYESPGLGRRFGDEIYNHFGKLLPLVLLKEMSCLSDGCMELACTRRHLP